MTISHFFAQFNVKYDKIIGGTQANSKIWLRNFKGVLDVGEKSYKDPSEERVTKNTNKLPAGDPLGHKSVLEFMLKLSLNSATNDTPYLGMYQMEDNFWTLRPFVFGNVAIFPQKFKDGLSLSENVQHNSLASAGMGLQLIHALSSFEVYYTVKLLNKQNYDYGIDFQFNFGLD